MKQISGEDLAALLFAIHDHDTTTGDIMYKESDLLPILEAVGLPTPKWGKSMTIEEFKKKYSDMEDKDLEVFNRQFHFSKEQFEKLVEWQESLPDKYFGADSNGITIEFPQCSIGVIIKAKRGEGEEIDLTDWDNF